LYTDIISSSCHKVKCDCCGKETLAEIRGNKLVIMDKRHGKRHVAVLNRDEILGIMEDNNGRR